MGALEELMDSFCHYGNRHGCIDCPLARRGKQWVAIIVTQLHIRILCKCERRFNKTT